MEGPDAGKEHSGAQLGRQRTLCWRAEHLIERGRAREALELVKQALAADPTDYRAHCVRAWALQEVDDYRGSLEATKLAIHLEPEDEWGHRLRAYAYLETSRYREALDAAQEAARLAPDSAAVMDCMSLCARAQGDMPLAREWAERAREQFPEDPRCHELLGTHSEQERKWIEAEECFRAALALEPCRWSSLEGLGRIREALGSRREAIPFYYQATLAAPWREGPRLALRWALFKCLWLPRFLALLTAGEIGWLLTSYGGVAPAAAWGVAAALFLAGDYLGVRSWLKSLPVPVEALPGSHQPISTQLVAAAPRPTKRSLLRQLNTAWLYATPLLLIVAEVAFWGGLTVVPILLLIGSVVNAAVWLKRRQHDEALPNERVLVADGVEDAQEAVPDGDPPHAETSSSFDLIPFQEVEDPPESNPASPSDATTDPDLNPRKQRARVLLDLSRPGEALALLQEEVRDDPADDVAWAMVAESFFSLRDHERCLRAAELALDAGPFRIPGHLWKCRSLLALERGEDALRAVRIAAELTSSPVEIRRLLVRSHLLCGYLQEASRELHDLAPRLQKDPEMACLRGELARKQGNAPLAEMEFRAALDLNRDQTEAWAGLAELRTRREQRQEAAHCFYEAARCNPQEPEYRRSMLALIDAEVEKRNEYAVPVFYCVMVIVGLIGYMVFPPLALGAIPLAVAGARSLHASTLRSVFYRLPPAVRGYYDAMKPVQNREDAANLRWGCGCLLSVVGIGVLLFQLTRHALWLPVLRLLLVSALLYPWLARLRPARPTRPAPDAIRFQFPGDPQPEGEPSGTSADPAKSLEAAWEMLRAGEPVKARELAMPLLAEDPVDVQAVRLVSLACLAAGDPQQGLAIMKRGRAHHPEDPELRALEWLQLAVEGEPEAALSNARQRADDEADYLDLLATALSELYGARAVDAVRAGALLLERLAPAAHQTYRVRGDLEYTERRWKDAEAAYRLALAGKPDSSLYLNNLGVVMIRQWRLAEGWRHLNLAVQLEPDCAIAVSSLNVQLGGATLVTSTLLSLLLGVLAMSPTLAGQPRNDWMPWATFAGPLVIGLLGRAALPALAALIAPKLSRDAIYGRSGEFIATALWSGLVLLILHSVQSWLEIGLHPALLAARWQGAATITFLAVYFTVLVRKSWFR